MEKVEIFTDAEYLLQSLRSLANKPTTHSIRKEDFKWHTFISYILHGRKVFCVNYYTARLDETENKATYDGQTQFLENIQQDLAVYNVKNAFRKNDKNQK